MKVDGSNDGMAKDGQPALTMIVLSNLKGNIRDKSQNTQQNVFVKEAQQ